MTSNATMTSRNQTNELLDVLVQVKARVQDKLGIVDFPMPQFIIIGSQSVGKSRLVEAFAGEQFNFVSGTLGSRRPTVLEFRMVPAATESKWAYFFENKWKYESMGAVQQYVGDSHNSLGVNVTKEPIYVRIESAKCVDMQVVDLPGYRGFADTPEKKTLADKIEELNKSFLQDSRNVVLCVEEAGDAANCKSLAKVREFDPSYKRTILVRNKLDKYYGDLDTSNVNNWLDGMGDLPRNLKKFAMTLPHWQEGQQPPKPLGELRDDMSDQDLNKLSSLGAAAVYLDTVGFKNFASYMENRIGKMFQEALGPVLTKLNELSCSMTQRDLDLNEERELCDPTQMLASVKAAGSSFAQCLTFVLEGYINSDINRTTLDDELRDFKKYHETLGDTDTYNNPGCKPGVPNADLSDLEDYIKYLQDEPAADGKGGGVGVPAFDIPLNGGAQYRRMMFEVETFLRFSEIGIDVKKRDVLQSFGIAMNSIGWREVIVKLLNNEGYIPLQQRITYVALRIQYFFQKQKDVVLQFMKSLKGSPEEKLYSCLYHKHAKLIEENPTVKKLVYDAYDRVVQRQLGHFINLFKSTLRATFANPWVFLKKSSGGKIDDATLGEEPQLASLEDTKARIPSEIQARGSNERKIQKAIYSIPEEVDDAVDQVQMLLLKVYGHIRSQVCDQVELFAESFFKLPLMRRLEEDMSHVALSKVDEEGYQARRDKVDKQLKANAAGLVEVSFCLKILEDFKLKTVNA